MWPLPAVAMIAKRTLQPPLAAALDVAHQWRSFVVLCGNRKLLSLLLARCQDGRTYVASCLAAAEITRADRVIVQRAVVVDGGVALLGWHGRDWQILEVLLGVGHIGRIYAPAGGKAQLLLVDHGALRQARATDPLVQPQRGGQLQQYNVSAVEELLVFGLRRSK